MIIIMVMVIVIVVAMIIVVNMVITVKTHPLNKIKWLPSFEKQHRKE